MKLINKLIELDNSRRMVVLKELITSEEWLGIKELKLISQYYPALIEGIATLQKNGMLIEKLEPYNCGRKNRKLWKVNKDNLIVKLLEKEI